jgi:hypothetical protein
MEMQSGMLVLLCVSFSVLSLKLPSGANKLGFTEFYPMKDLSSMAEMLVQADPTKVDEIIALLESLKNDSIKTENILINAVNASKGNTATAKTALDEAKLATRNAEVALEATPEFKTHGQAVIHETEKSAAYSSAQHAKVQAQANLDHQKPLLDSDQKTIDTIIVLLQNITFTSAPTSSPTSPTLGPTASPTPVPTSSPTASPITSIPD